MPPAADEATPGTESPKPATQELDQTTQKLDQKTQELDLSNAAPAEHIDASFPLMEPSQDPIGVTGSGNSLSTLGEASEAGHVSRHATVANTDAMQSASAPLTVSVLSKPERISSQVVINEPAVTESLNPDSSKTMSGKDKTAISARLMSTAQTAEATSIEDAAPAEESADTEEASADYIGASKTPFHGPNFRTEKWFGDPLPGPQPGWRYSISRPNVVRVLRLEGSDRPVLLPLDQASYSAIGVAFAKDELRQAHHIMLHQKAHGDQAALDEHQHRTTGPSGLNTWLSQLYVPSQGTSWLIVFGTVLVLFGLYAIGIFMIDWASLAVTNTWLYSNHSWTPRMSSAWKLFDSALSSLENVKASVPTAQLQRDIPGAIPSRQDVAAIILSSRSWHDTISNLQASVTDWRCIAAIFMLLTAWFRYKYLAASPITVSDRRNLLYHDLASKFVKMSEMSTQGSETAEAAKGKVEKTEQGISSRSKDFWSRIKKSSFRPIRLSASRLMLFVTWPILWFALGFVSGLGVRDLWDGFQKVEIVVAPCIPVM